MTLSGNSEGDVVSVDVLIPFRGRRTYIQSASIMDKFCPYFYGGSSIVLKFPNFIRSNLVSVHFVDGQNLNLPKSEVGCDCFWSVGGIQRRIQAVPMTTNADRISEEYDEARVLEGMDLVEGRGSLPPSGTYSSADRVVALTKAYLENSKPIGSDYQYIATRMDFDLYFPGDLGIAIRPVSSIADRHFIFRIETGGDPMGSIYFSLVKRS
jgi:hypothetical protein